MSRLGTQTTGILLASTLGATYGHADDLPVHNLEGGDHYETVVTGHLVVQKGEEAKVALLRITEMTAELRKSLLASIQSGNMLAQEAPGGAIDLRLGCLEGKTVVNDDRSVIVPSEVLNSNARKPATVTLEFKEHLSGWGGECISLVDGLRVADTTSGTKASR